MGGSAEEVARQDHGTGEGGRGGEPGGIHRETALLRGRRGDPPAPLLRIEVDGVRLLPQHPRQASLDVAHDNSPSRSMPIARLALDRTALTPIPSTSAISASDRSSK